MSNGAETENLELRPQLEMSFTKLLFTILFKSIYALKNWVLPRYKKIHGEIVLITGGGRGIGRQLALDIASHRPLHIILWGRKEECLRSTRDDIRELGVKSSYYICDVSEREQIYATARKVIEEVGHVTILINNAGVVSGKPLLDLSESSIINSMRVNTLSQIWTIKAFLPEMITKNRGHIVSMSSMLGLLGLKGTIDYTASKFSTTGLMESLMSELEVYPGINTTILHPYQVDNEMFAGCKVRFPWLFPPLKERYVCQQSVKAILTNRRQLILPFYFHFVLFFKSFLPTASLLPSLQFLGLDKAMDSFDKTTDSHAIGAQFSTSEGRSRSSQDSI